MSPTLRNKWEQTQCRKQEIQGRSMSDECIAARRLSSILNKAVYDHQLQRGIKILLFFFYMTTGFTA
jgi:hypothetical protein